MTGRPRRIWRSAGRPLPGIACVTVIEAGAERHLVAA